MKDMIIFQKRKKFVNNYEHGLKNKEKMFCYYIYIYSNSHKINKENIIPNFYNFLDNWALYLC